MMSRCRIAILLSSSMFAACSGGSGDDDFDAAVVVADADPNAPDADPNAPDADPTAPDAMPGAPDASTVGDVDAGATAGISCGDQTCDETTQECCASGGGGGGFMQECVAVGTCQGTPATCDGPEDCGGDLCCGSFSGASCETTCQGQAAEICHTEADCSVAGDMCCDIAGFISICQAQCFGGGGGI